MPGEPIVSVVLKKCEATALGHRTRVFCTLQCDTLSARLGAPGFPGIPLRGNIAPGCSHPLLASASPPVPYFCAFGGTCAPFRMFY